MTTPADMGEKLRRRRVMLGLTQAHVAKKLKISQVMVSRWEKGGGWIPSQKMEKLGKILGVSVNYFWTDLRPIVRQKK